MPPPSATAERLAEHWVADALAAEQSIDFSVIKGKPQALIAYAPYSILLHSSILSPRVPGAPPALVDVSSEYLVDAPDAARERVALRCLQEFAAFADAHEGGAAAAPAPSEMLRIDAAVSCKELLVELIGLVGSSRSFDNDVILPFRQDIQNFICIKKPTLPETSLELLREVDLEIQPMVAPSPVEQNGIKKHSNHQPLCNVNHLHSNIEKPRLPTVSTELQSENITNIVNETEIGNFQQCSIKPTIDLDQRLEKDSRFYNQPKEDVINAASVGARPTEKNPSNVDSDMADSSASCNAALQGNIAEHLSKINIVDQPTVVQAQPCKGKSPNPPDYTNMVKGPNDDGISGLSSKDPRHESQTMQATMTPDFDRNNDYLPTNTSEESHLPEFDTSLVQQMHSCKTRLNHPRHDSGQKVNQVMDSSTSTQPVEKDSIHVKSTLRAARVLPSVSFNGDMQEDKSESCSCDVTLHDKTSEAHCSSEQNIGKNTTDIQKRSCNISIRNSSQNGNQKTAKQNSNKQTVGKTVLETSHVPSSYDISSGVAAACLVSMTGKIPLCSQHQETNHPLGVSPEPDLCIKCGKDSHLLQCSSCLLSAHDSCFGSSVTFEVSGLFYCPVCICTKATEAYQKAKETYIEARKNLAAFLGAEQLLKQHNKQQTGVLSRVANSEDSSERKNSCSQTKADDLAHQDEESERQRKKQKMNVTSDACNEVAIEKASSIRNSDVAPMNKHSVLQNNSNKLQDAEQDHVESTEANEDAGNGYLSAERRNSSQNRCSPAANLEVESDKEDGPTNSHQSEDTDEIEATSSSDSGKPSSPPWRTIKHHKARPQEREASGSSNPTKAYRQKDQHVPLPSKKQNYAPKRYSNPAVPTGRGARSSVGQKRKKQLLWKQWRNSAHRTTGLYHGFRYWNTTGTCFTRHASHVT